MDATREDRATLFKMGFTEQELRDLDLWDIQMGAPSELAEAYIRRSRKRDDLTSLRGHLKDIVRAARAEGLRIRHVWFEQRSASKATVRREEFENACAAVFAGLSKALFIWKTDRLSRRGMGQVGLLLDEFDKRRARILSVTEGLDSSKGTRMVFAILSERARDEAKDTALRTKSGKDEHKVLGRWPGGKAPYGLQSIDGRLSHLPEEYPHSRRIAEGLLADKTPREIVNGLNKDGHLTRGGFPWRPQSIVQLVHSAGWAGLIPDHKRDTDEYGQPLETWHRDDSVLRDASGDPISCGQGVVTYAEWITILGKMAARSSGTHIGNKTRGKRAPKTTASHVLKCPHCKGPTVNGGANYRCVKRKNFGADACEGLCVKRSTFEEGLERLWMEHILNLSPASPTIHTIARQWLAYKNPESEKRKKDADASLTDAQKRGKRLNQRYFVVGDLPEEEYDEMREGLDRQIAGLKAELATLAKEADLSPLMDPQYLAALWNGATYSDQRALLSAALVEVTMVPPAHKGDRTPIIDRIVPTWRDTTSAAGDEAYAAARRSAAREAAAA